MAPKEVMRTEAPAGLSLSAMSSGSVATSASLFASLASAAVASVSAGCSSSPASVVAVAAAGAAAGASASPALTSASSYNKRVLALSETAWEPKASMARVKVILESILRVM